MTALEPSSWYRGYKPTLEDWQAAFDAAGNTSSVNSLFNNASTLISDGDTATLAAAKAFANNAASVASALASRLAVISRSGGLGYNVLDYGAKGDGVTPDATAFRNAIQAAFSAGGGRVVVPATGSAYVIESGLVLPSGVSIAGERSPHWYGPNQIWQQWTKMGPVLNPTDIANPCITVAGVGCKIVGLAFVHNQPVPSNTPNIPYVPTTYPWCIRVTQNFVGLEDIHIVNATHGISWDYTSTSGGGTYCYMRNIFSGALVCGVYFHCVNDTMRVNNYRERSLWYGSNSNVVDWMETNKVGWWMQYLDNIQASDIEFFQCWKAIRGSDGTVNAGGFNLTHALVLGQFVNFSFNLCVQGIDLDLPSTRFSATFVNVIVQSDTSTGRAAGYFFNLASNNADVTMIGVTAPQVGHSFMAVGGGASGRAAIRQLRLDYYSSNGAGSPAFLLGVGATLDMPDGSQNVTRVLGAGQIVAGAGAVRSVQVPTNLYANREGGTVGLIAAASGDDTAGYVGFYGTDGTRRGYIGANSPQYKETTVASDLGSVNILSSGCRLYVQSDGQIVFADANGARKARLDCGTGNLVISGVLTQNGTP